MSMLPDLAKLDPQEFVASYFTQAMIYLLNQLKKEKERPSAFISIGEISLAVGSAIAPYIDAIIAAVKDMLISKG